MAFAPVFRRSFDAVFDRAGASVSWWLSGGVAAANAIAVYQPKSAASLAASYTNLANPGTYDAAPGVAPTWTAARGWIFNASEYLTTGITPPNTNDWSILIRTASQTNTSFRGSGCYNATFGFLFDASGVYYFNGGQLYKTPAHTSGVLGVAGNVGYRNGVPETGTITSSAGAKRPLYIGAINDGTVNYKMIADILAIAIYNTTLDATQMAAVSTAMAAL